MRIALKGRLYVHIYFRGTKRLNFAWLVTGHAMHYFGTRLTIATDDRFTRITASVAYRICMKLCAGKVISSKFKERTSEHHDNDTYKAGASFWHSSALTT